VTPKEKISVMVNESNGLKATELLLKVVNKYPEMLNVLDGSEIAEVLEELVKEGEIVELEYVLPHMKYRVKSIYFPRGTEIVKDKK
jgi:hypothetical protein